MPRREDERRGLYLVPNAAESELQIDPLLDLQPGRVPEALLNRAPTFERCTGGAYLTARVLLAARL